MLKKKKTKKQKPPGKQGFNKLHTRELSRVYKLIFQQKLWRPEESGMMMKGRNLQE